MLIRSSYNITRKICKPINYIRNFSTSTTLTQSRPCEEVRIPAPWGEIAGKWWGPRDMRPILGVHGWQDNSGTFDRLVPFLPSNVGFLAIDMPGHGLSSQMPAGSFYHGIDISIFIKKIVDHFNWSKVSLLGHSLGGMNTFVYTMLFPETVDFLICLDGFPFRNERNLHPNALAKTITNFLRYDAINNSITEPPSYTFKELEQLLHKGSRKSVTVESAKYILKRNVRPAKNTPDEFYIARDARLKVGSLLHWTQEDIFEGCKRITCPFFLSLGKQSQFMQLEDLALEMLNIIKKNNPNVEYHRVEGTHHLHLNTPENVGDLVRTFIEKYDVGDRSVVDLENKLKIVV